LVSKASEGDKISNIEIKNFIEHSFKIIISSFNDRLNQIENRISRLEKSLTDPLSPSDPEIRKQTEVKRGTKDTDPDLSDALKLIGQK
jgi:hypothetical protein